MKSTVVDSGELFLAITSEEVSNDVKLDLILSLKNHIKKDYVDMNHVPQYLQALSIGVDIDDLDISSNSFSVLCHLVRRVSMQDNHGVVLKLQSYLILPIIINRLSNAKKSLRLSASKALEAYWLTAPQQVEQTVLEIGLQNRNTGIVVQSIAWLNHIVNDINPHFKLLPFIPQLCKILTTNNPDTYVAIEDLFVDFYNLKHNKIFRHDLEKSLSSNSVNSSITNEIMNKILSNGNLTGTIVSNASKMNNDPHLTPKITHRAIHSDSTRPKSIPTTNSATPSSFSHQGSDIHPSATPRTKTPVGIDELPESPVKFQPSDSTISPQLEQILKKVRYTLAADIPAVYINSPRQLHSVFEELIRPFNGKETEQNWNLREKNIIKLRSILRGNVSMDFKDDLVSNLRDFVDGFCKSMASLRTTLSTNGCQLVKDCCIIIGAEFDSIVDSIMATMMKLCSATKQIASSNANMAICSVFIYLPFNYRYLLKIVAASNEKNVLPRSYSGLWMQILLIRFHDNTAFVSPHGANGLSGVDISTKVLQKLLGDANPAVRQIARECFWTLWERFPSIAEALLSKLEPKVVKALDKSKPSNLGTPLEIKTSTTIKKLRPSLKESIIERNKELRLKQKSTSRASSRSASLIDFEADSSSFTKSSTVENKSTVPGHHQSNRLDSRHTSRMNQFLKEDVSVVTTRMNGSVVDEKQAEHIVHKQHHAEIPSVPGRDNDTLLEVHSHNSSPKIQVEDKEILSDSGETVIDISTSKPIDPILKFLSSNQTEYIKEGISLLKYALIADEEMSTDINGLLKKISFREPELLRPLFLSSDSLFKKCHKFFNEDDFLRVCSILINPLNGNHVDLIISVMNVYNLLDSIIKLLSIVINPSYIMDDDNGELAMQILKYQSVIVTSLIEFLLTGLDKIPVSDSYVLKLTSNFLELVHLLKSTKVYNSFFQLIEKLYKINPTLFIAELELTDKSTKEEVGVHLGVGQVQKSYSSTNYGDLALPQNGTSTSHNESSVDFSPIKSDFTMILPVMKENNEYTFIPKRSTSDNLGASQGSTMETVSETIQEEQSLEDEISKNDSMEIDTDIQTKSDELNVSQSDDLNSRHVQDDIAMERPELVESNEFEESQVGQLENAINDSIALDDRTMLQHNSLDQSTGLVEDFSQVKITEHFQRNKFEDKESLQSFLDKVDPLRAISSKNKKINIFEDSTGSPQKVRDYNYGEVNWFNFQLSKLTPVDIGENLNIENQFSEDNFKWLCKQISTQTILDDTFVTALKYIQEYKSIEKFSEYFESQGKTELENALWSFFNSIDKISPSLILSGLIIFKLLLVNKIEISLSKLWETLMDLYQCPKVTYEVNVAIGEVFDEILVGVYSSSDIVDTVLRSLNNVSDCSLKYVIGVLSCLLKLLSQEYVQLIINDEIISEINTSIKGLISHEEVEVRRYTIQIYSRLVKATTLNGCHSMNDIMNGLTIPQKNLINHYSLE
jgi:CLIP-associating protein 1/2